MFSERESNTRKTQDTTTVYNATKQEIYKEAIGNAKTVIIRKLASYELECTTTINAKTNYNKQGG